MSAPFTLVASIGTYHEPFERFVVWLEQWSAAHDDVRVVLQHGTTRPMQGGENHEMLPIEELLALYRSADVLLLQGGTGGIMDARHTGRLPIVVPRRPAAGEHVDDHQLLCTRELADLGLIHRADDRDDLFALLDQAYAGTLETRTEDVDDGIGAIRSVELLSHLPRRRSSRERLGMAATVLRGSFGRRVSHVRP